MKCERTTETSSLEDHTAAASSVVVLLAVAGLELASGGSGSAGTTCCLLLRETNAELKVDQLESRRQEGVVTMKLTLLYLRISRTRLLKASSTLSLCFAEVSMNWQPKCLASSRPSAIGRVKSVGYFE